MKSWRTGLPLLRQRIDGAVLAGAITITLAATLVPERAAAIDIGYNALHIVDDGLSQITFGNPLGTGSPITVELTGASGPQAPDVLISRTAPLTNGVTGTIPIELVALSLQSVAPVIVGGSQYDVTIMLDPATPSRGQIDVTSWEPGNTGGLYDILLNLALKVTLVDTQTGQTDFDFLLQRAVDADPHYTGFDPPRYFYYGLYPVGGMHLDEAFALKDGDPASLYLSLESAQIAEPATLGLAGFGLAGLGLALRRRRSA